MQHVNQIVSAGNGVLVVVTIDRSVSAITQSSLTSLGYSPQGLPFFVFNPPKCLIKEITLYKIKISGYFQSFTLHFPGRWSLVVKAYTHEDLHRIVLVLCNADNYRKKTYFKVSLPNLTTVHPKINVSNGGGLGGGGGKRT